MPYKRLLSTICTIAGCAGATSVDVDAGDASSGTCSNGQVTFMFRRVAGATTNYCIGAPGACSHAWLSISSSTGSTLVIDKPCQAECSKCEPIGCPASCAAPTAMKADGEQGSWSGVYYASSTCGASMSCVAPACAPPGHYTAKMCAYAETDTSTVPFCNAGQVPTCATVEFDWPPPGGTATVTGTIDDTTDGGNGDGNEAS